MHLRQNYAWSYKRALAIREKALGANHLDVGQSLNGLRDLRAT
jgi:hypothetical protein